MNLARWNFQKGFFWLRFPISRYCFLCLLSVCHSVNVWPLKWEVLCLTFLAQAQQRPREAHSINPSGWSELIWIRLRSLVAWKKWCWANPDAHTTNFTQNLSCWANLEALTTNLKQNLTCWANLEAHTTNLNQTFHAGLTWRLTSQT